MRIRHELAGRLHFLAFIGCAGNIRFGVLPADQLRFHRHPPRQPRCYSIGRWNRWQTSADSLKKLLAIRSPTGRPVLSAAFSPDGAQLGVLVYSETVLRMWDVDGLCDSLSALGLGW